MRRQKQKYRKCVEKDNKEENKISAKKQIFVSSRTILKLKTEKRKKKKNWKERIKNDEFKKNFS